MSFRPLKYGTLPTVSFLAVVTGDATEAREALELMRRNLQRFGPNDSLHELLKAYGFEWSAEAPLPDPDLQEAIDSVAAALGEVES